MHILMHKLKLEMEIELAFSLAENCGVNKNDTSHNAWVQPAAIRESVHCWRSRHCPVLFAEQTASLEKYSD